MTDRAPRLQAKIGQACEFDHDLSTWALMDKNGHLWSSYLGLPD
jgi:hypothetical protein